MALPPHDAEELEKIYRLRFSANIAYRNEVWKTLISGFFSKYFSPTDHVLDLGCGYGEFINNIHCGKKTVLDMNPSARQHAAPDVTVVEQDCTQPWPFPDESIDLVFTSNLLEHLPSKSAMRDTIKEARRCLRKNGRLVALGPNIRFVGGAYWDFLDHHLPLTDSSMRELLEVAGFRVEECYDRFIPYTMANTRRVPILLVSLYLKLPLAWKLFGKQFLVVGRK